MCVVLIDCDLDNILDLLNLERCLSEFNEKMMGYLFIFIIHFIETEFSEVCFSINRL